MSKLMEDPKIALFVEKKMAKAAKEATSRALDVVKEAVIINKNNMAIESGARAAVHDALKFLRAAIKADA